MSEETAQAERLKALARGESMYWRPGTNLHVGDLFDLIAAVQRREDAPKFDVGPPTAVRGQAYMVTRVQ